MFVYIYICFEKDLLLCRICASRLELYHKISHQKFNMFTQCTQRVANHRALFAQKLPTDILNEMLADDSWITDVFKSVRYTWAEVDHIERQHRFAVAARTTTALA